MYNVDDSSIDVHAVSNMIIPVQYAFFKSGVLDASGFKVPSIQEHQNFPLLLHVAYWYQMEQTRYNIYTK